MRWQSHPGEPIHGMQPPECKTKIMIILLVPVFTCSVQLWKLDSSIETAESCPAMARSSTWHLADFETGVEVYSLQKFKVSGEIGEINLYLHEFLVWTSFLSPALSQFVTDLVLRRMCCVFLPSPLSHQGGAGPSSLPLNPPSMHTCCSSTLTIHWLLFVTLQTT